MRLVGVAAVVHLGLMALLFVGVSRWYTLGPGAPLAPAERAEVIAHLRALIEGRAPAFARAATGWRGVATVLCDGRIATRAPLRSRAGIGLAPDAPDAPDAEHAPDAPRAIDPAPLRALPAAVRHACRVQVDVVGGVGPIVAGAPLFALSLVPGLDGIGLRIDGGEGAPAREVLLTPDELVAAGLASGAPLAPGIDVDVGVDGRGVISRLARDAGLDADGWRRARRTLFRFRSHSFVEPAPDAPPTSDPIAIVRGHRAVPESATPDALRAAARAGGRYLLDHLHADGRFDYLYFPQLDAASPDDAGYSLPRHAGATWFLAQLAGANLREPALRDGAARALRFLRDRRPDGCDRPDLACVGDPGDRTVDLGAASLALVAAVEYHRATGDAEFQPFAARLANFLLAMQLPDGAFCHLFDPLTAERDTRTRLLYFSGEAAFALAQRASDQPLGAAGGERPADFLAHAVDDPVAPTHLSRAVERALDHLTGVSDQHFALQFFFGEEHWTCLAVDQAWDLLGDGPLRDRLGDFCEGFAAWLARTQFDPTDAPTRAQPDLSGAYGFSPLLAPHTTPVGSRTEALVAAYRIAARRGHAAAAAAMAARIDLGVRFLLARQLAADTSQRFPSPGRAAGGFLQSDVKPVIRIDFVQHAGSALLQAADLYEEAGFRAALPAPPGSRPPPRRGPQQR